MTPCRDERRSSPPSVFSSWKELDAAKTGHKPRLSLWSKNLRDHSWSNSAIMNRRGPGYFGRTDWSPPGLPGGGITGVLPVSGVGARISGSTPVGGHNTPSDLASLSPNCSGACPVVVSRGDTVPCCGFASVGAQSRPVRTGGAGAVWAAGAACGGAWAKLSPVPATARINANHMGCVIFIPVKRRSAQSVPISDPYDFR